jgi:hypothetical protein
MASLSSYAWICFSLCSPPCIIFFRSLSFSARENFSFKITFTVQEEPIMDIPDEISMRPPSEYRDRLIEELKRPFDKCEYRELMEKSTCRTKKIVYKELRHLENAKKAEATPRIRKRAIETEEDSKSFFDWYPGKFHIFVNLFYKMYTTMPDFGWVKQNNQVIS